MNQPMPLDQIAAADIAYIRQHWTALAAAAWHGYMHYGRGIIVIDRANGREPSICYRTHVITRAAHRSGWLSAETAAQIRQYDPRHELICLVVYDEATVTTYRLSVATLTPPDAYAQLYLHSYVPSA